MFQTLSAAILITLTGSVAAAQTVQPFVGTWVAEFDGTAWVRLELRAAGESLAGRIALGDMEVDAEGRVKAAHAAPDRLAPIFDVVLRDSTLTFARKDGADTDRFELHLAGSDAELRFVLDEATRKELMDEGIAPPKPVQLKRIAR